MGTTQGLVVGEASATDTRAEAPADDVDETARADTRRNRRLVGLTLALAALPFVVSAVALFLHGYGNHLPTGDYAMIEARVDDVIGDPPLIGLYSRADWAHPGPLQFYVLTPFYWLSGGAAVGINLGALVINGGSVIGMALIARRRGGLPLTLCVVVASGLLMRTLGAEFVHDPWNTFLTVFPYGLLVFLTWSMTCGDRWALPAGVFVASFLAQTHVGFVPLAIPLVLWGAAWLVVTSLRAEGGGMDEWSADEWLRRLRPLRWPMLVSGAIAVLAWLPPLIDFLSHTQSNVRRAADWFGEAAQGTKGLTDGLRVMVGQFELPPEWLITKRDSAFPLGESPFLVGPFPWPVLLLPVAIAAISLWWSRRAERRQLVGLFVLTLVVGTAAVARTVGPAFDYRLRWSWVPPMIAFVVVSWAAWLAATRWRPRVTPWLVSGAVGILMVVTSVNVVTAAQAGNPGEGETDVVATIGPPALEAVDDVDGDGVVLVTEPFHQAAVYARGLAWYLDQHGVDVRVEPTLALHFGEHRAYDGEPVDAVLMVVADSGLDTADGDPEVAPVARWETDSIEMWEEVRQARDDLDAALASGAIDATEHAIAITALPKPTSSAAFAHRVGVYLDERRPVDEIVAVGHSPSP